MRLLDPCRPQTLRQDSKQDAVIAAALVESTPAVLRVCRRFVSTPGEAEELCQEALLVAWRRRAVWSGEGTVQAWACAIGRNLGRNARRKRKELLRDPDLPEPAADQPTVTEQIFEAQRRTVLHAALARMPSDERQVLSLRYAAGWTAPRINAHLGLEGAGARAILQRARRRLRRLLDEAPQANLYDDLRLAS